jgi:uncharacterized protein DUF748
MKLPRLSFSRAGRAVGRSLGGAGRSVGRFARNRWPVFLLILAIPAALIVAADVLLDEPLRQQTERRMNERLQGYHVTLRHLDFHVIGLSVDLEDLVVLQDAHPDPPVARIPRLSASVQWRALLHRAVVADFRFTRPVVYVNLEHFQQEAKDEVPVEKRGWQEALEAIYPFKINQLKVVEGQITYEDRGPAPPLELSHVNFVVRNIRNVASPEDTYPSTLHLEARVFDKGKLWLDGRADFMATPHLGVRANIRLDDITLAYIKPVAAHYHLDVEGGTLAAAGTVEYAPDGATLGHLQELTVRGAKVDYIHSVEAKPKEEQAKEKTVEKAKEVNNAPGILLRVDRAHVTGTFGFVNKAARPAYRVFLSDTSLEMTNLTNQFTEGTAVATLKGKFMGSGATLVNANFRPENQGPDFDMAVRVDDTDMRTMNDLLRAYGKFDVVAGIFSLFMELNVKRGEVTGYIKPLFSDMDVYDKRQDKEKSLFRKAYEGLVGGVAKLLQNKPRQEVATKAEIHGRLDDPKLGTWQAVVRLVENAFFRAILPGFDRELGQLRR